MILDAHVYCLPPRLRDPGVRLPETEAPVLDALHRHPDGPTALALSAPDAIVRSMAASGVGGALLVAMPWTDPALCRETNDYLLGLGASDSRFRAICAVQPAAAGWREEADRCLAAGAVGLKVNPAWQGYDLDGPEMDALAAHLAGGKAFIMCHIDQAYKPSRTSPARLYALAPRHPRTRFLAAHMGGLLGLYNLRPENRAALANIWYDTAVSQTLRMVSFYVEAGLSERVVFGTDYPFNHCHDQETVVDGIRELRLPAATESAIFSGNLERLIGGVP
jgi:uncharacterized protein